MFNCLGEFPLLTCFNFQASFSRNLSVDPSSLSNMLNKHRHQLEILVLRLDTTPHLAALSHQPLSEWLRSTFQENHFSRLQQLQLYPSALPQGFDGLLSCIQQSAETLQRLVVREHYLDVEGVTRLLNHIPPNLQFLRLNVHELTIEIFDDLAAKLPRLYSLSLYITHMPPTFAFDIENRSFKDWNLYNIGIWQSGSMASIHLMRLIKATIPSVDSFWDLGTEELSEPHNLECICL
ncbi:hypothetical protein BT96DRAFT_827717 [Gymnopus androsaceus JB14]|uniref:F-box domain-containing protein n=1 Tax=Gymnopus androsaceus JB14 TaxID=1447944 RepID=A0A6A4H9B7_9AGAR|nr:hypothetical protein BT96DRAFT_827717 [Gymnopus androsaceus JB14]